MADDVDRAQRLNEQHQEQVLAEHRSRLANAGPGSPVCLECGDDIPAERRKQVAGCSLCIDCQRAYEEQLKKGG